MVVQFSIIEKTSGILTKRFFIDNNGELAKDSSKCFLQHGKVETVTCEFSDLPEILHGLKENQALVHGTAEEAEGGPIEIVSQGMLANYPGAITRTKDTFSYPDTGIVMFDYDVQDGKEALTKHELITAVRSLHPQLEKCAMIWRPSASSCLVAEGGAEYLGIKNQRIYVPYENPEFMQEFIENLEKLAWDKKHGYIFISAAGTPLTRCIFDTAVFSPERLDFAAGAVCDAPLSQTLPKPTFQEGEYLDFADSSLNVPAERFNSQVEKAKLKLKDDLDAARKRYVNKQVTKLVSEKKLTKSKAKLTVESRLRHKLLPTDILYTDDMEPIAVSELLNNPEVYNGTTVRDPIEPEYGKSKAKIFIDDDHITINSFAHGGRVFSVSLDSDFYLKWLEGLDPDDLSNAWLDEIDNFIGSNVDKEKIIDVVKEKTGLSKAVLKKDLNEREKALYKEEAEILDLTHHQIANLQLAEMPQHTVATEGQIYSYDGEKSWQSNPLVDVEMSIARNFDGAPKCSRKSDYLAVSKHLYNMVLDEKFFSDTPDGVATNDGYWYIGKDSELRREDHKPEHRIRFNLPFDMAGEDEEMPLFDNFVDWAFPNDPQQKLLLQEVFGAVIFGAINRRYHKAVLFRGHGSNGKGVMTDILKGLIPSQYVSNVTPFRWADPVYTAQMAGKLLNIVTELEKHQVLPGASFKSVVDSGEIMGKPLYHSPFSFPTTAAQVFSSNHTIKTTDDSKGMQRRWLIFSFDNIMEEGKDQIAELGKIIAKQESPQILRWAANGLIRLSKNKEFTTTSTNSHYSEKMFGEVNNINVFLRDQDFVIAGTPDDIKKRVLRVNLYNIYKDWCVTAGYKPNELYKKVYFNSYLQENLGYQCKKFTGKHYWLGIKANIVK